MSDYDIHNVHEDIQEGNLDCENIIKHSLLNALTNYGTNNVEGRKIWELGRPIAIIGKILGAVQTTLDEKVDSSGEPASEKQLDTLRILYVRLYIIRRHIKTMLDEEE